ncbi:MAG: Methyltransferase type 12 [Solirubrobacterales bacterium]|nr:Methyltransferase type 12 [Solirubrobacterales bacterium]
MSRDPDAEADDPAHGTPRDPTARRPDAAIRDPGLVAGRIEIGPVALDVLRPLDVDALLDEEAFEHEEFLPYWAELWPSASTLAERLLDRELDGVRVLELGCGLGVSGLVAARRGARVTATDWAPDALALLARNAEVNGVELELRRLDWFAPGDAWPEGLPEPWPLVIAADVLYESRHVPAVLALLDRVVAPGGEAWIADPGRPPARTFLREAATVWRADEVGPAEPGAPVVRRLRRR